MVSRLVLLSALILGVVACKSREGTEDPRTTPRLVVVSTVQQASSSDRASTGSVAARVQSNLGFRVSGKVVQRLVDAGQEVHKGQPLMQLDRTDYAHLVASQTGSADAARARMLQAVADEERYRGLVASGAVSQSAYDQVKAAADSSRALLAAAEAQLKVAQDDGEYSVLAADADGTVVDTLVEPGQFVAAGQIVVRLAHAGPREASVNLPEMLRPAIGSSARAKLYGFDSDTSPTYTARLRQLSDSADPTTRTYEARYVLEGAAAQAPLGATVTVYLPQARLNSELAVPFGALDDEGKGPGVWVVKQNPSSVASVGFQPVTFVRFEGERAVISGGVHLGDTIVATGGHYLHEGEPVRLATIQASMQ